MSVTLVYSRKLKFRWQFFLGLGAISFFQGGGPVASTPRAPDTRVLFSRGGAVGLMVENWPVRSLAVENWHVGNLTVKNRHVGSLTVENWHVGSLAVDNWHVGSLAVENWHVDSLEIET